MQKRIDIELIKENLDLFFSQLDKESEKEFIDLFNFLVYRYNININLSAPQKAKKVNKKDKTDFLAFLKKGFSVSEDEINAIKSTTEAINKWKIQKF